MPGMQAKNNNDHTRTSLNLLVQIKENQGRRFAHNYRNTRFRSRLRFQESSCQRSV